MQWKLLPPKGSAYTADVVITKTSLFRNWMAYLILSKLSITAVRKILLLSNVLTTTNWSTCSFFVLCGELNVHRKIQYCRQSRDKHWGHSTCSVLPSLLQYMNKQHLFPLNVLCKYSCTLNPRKHGHNPFPSQILVFHFGHA